MNITTEKIKHYLKEILYFIITITIVANAMSLYRSQSLSSAPLEMRSFKLIDNSTYSLDSKKPILIHFWATWCPTCKLEAANINFLNRYYQIITIAVKSGSDYEIKKYLDKHDYHFKVVNDKDGSLSRKFKIAAYPTTFIYDTKQQLRFSEVGYTSTFGLWLRLLWAGL
ncbi:MULTISPECIES: protein disulfide oxidoreductase [Sulfurimonas]|uniref:protein disulfide oxidoreductase n=1 Tax=Sulfurimonas TaxID=202746 RepID=UPI0012643E7B|nr:protein disulfide oxidoreductase [Sulfurimonas indica]